MKRRSVPLVTRSRVMLSSQRLWPISCNFWVAFIISLLDRTVRRWCGRPWPPAIRAGRNPPAAGSSSGCLLGFGVVPTAVWSDDRVSLFRPPATALIGASPVVVFKDWIDYRPGGLNRTFTGEERSIAGHGVPQKPCVGRFRCRFFFKQVELSLVPDELLPCELDASRDGDGRAGGKPEAHVVGAAGLWRRVGEKPLRRRLQLH